MCVFVRVCGESETRGTGFVSLIIFADTMILPTTSAFRGALSRTTTLLAQQDGIETRKQKLAASAMMRNVFLLRKREN